MKTQFLLFALVLGIFPAFSQPTWQKTFGTAANEEATWVIPSASGGYLICGNSLDVGSAKKDALLLKIDDSGNSIWQKTFAVPTVEMTFRKVMEAPDGSIFGIGTSRNLSNGDENMLLSKYLSTGALAWTGSFGSGGQEVGYNVIWSDNALVVVGFSDNLGAGGLDLLLFKVKTDGTLIWGKTFGGINNDWSGDVVETGDGNLIACANTINFGWAGSHDIMLLKIDQAGNLLSGTTTGGGADDGMNHLARLSDGNLLGHDVSWSFGNGILQGWITKMTENGAVLWSKSVSRGNEHIRTIAAEHPAGGFVVAVPDRTPSANSDGVLARLSANGNLLFSKKFGGSGLEDFRSIIPTNDGGMLAVGKTDSWGNGGTDFFVVKTDANGEVENCCSKDGGVQVKSVQLQNSTASPATSSSSLFNKNNWQVNDYQGLWQTNCLDAPTADFSLPKKFICQNTCLLPQNTAIQTGVDYAWQFPGGSPAASSLAQPDSVCYALPGKYFIVLTAKQAECTATKIDSIEVGAVGSLTIDSLRICQGESVFTHGQWVSSPAVFNDTIPKPGGCPDLLRTVVWLENPTILTDSLLLCPLDSIQIGGIWRHPPGVFFDTLPNPPGCPRIEKTVLFVAPDSLRTDSLGLCDGDSIYINDRWIFGPGEFERIVLTENGCVLIEKTIVFLKKEGCSVACKIYWPNVFSPNDDGKNDFWMPLLDCPLSNFDLKIFDRWGELLFQTTDPQSLGWNGSFRGKKLGNGVFVWLAEFEIEELTGGPRRHFVKKGDLTLAK